VEPINYILDVKNPIEEAIKGYTMGRNDIAQRQDMQIQQQNAAMERQAFADQQTALAEQRAAAAQQQAAAAEYQQDLMVLRDAAANKTLTTEMQDAFNLKYASNQAEIKTAFDAMSEPKRAEQTAFGINLVTSLLSGNAPAAVAMLKERIVAAENSGNTDESAKLRANLKIIEMDPYAAAISIGSAMTAADAIKPDVWKSILEATQPIGQDFRPATPEESARYGAVAGQVNVKTGEFKAINPQIGFSVVTTPEGGTTITQGPGVGGGVGKRTDDYVYTTNAQGVQVAQPIAGTPAALQVTETAGRLDSAIEVGQNMLSTIESIVGRPAGDGLTAVKPSPALPGIVGLIDGRLPAKTQAQADLLAKYEQIQGQAFLEAFSILKGAGAITEQEGIKATQAYARTQRTQSPEAFTASMNEFADIVRLGMKRAKDQKLALPKVAAATSEGNGLPQSFLSDQSAIDAARNAGVTLQDMWNIMTPANKARYGK
jgi:hypothetical protein